MRWAKRRCATCFLVVAAILAAARAEFSQSVFAEPAWRAGAARIKITPEKFMWMAGYAARNRPADGKLTDLWAKALALEDGSGDGAVLVTMDLVGLDRDLSQSVCRKLERRYGLERRQIALCVSHTHSGPVVGRNLAPMHYDVVDRRQRQLIDEYAEQLQEKLVAVVGEALQRRAPSRLSWGCGRATFAVNRRNNPAADVPRLRSEGKLRGPFDHDVPVLAVRDAQDQLTAVVFGYACHATTLSIYRWSGDYPGFAQIALEDDHPGCVALFWAGCGADQNPLPRRSVARAMTYGGRLANAVNEVLEGEMSPIRGDLATSYEEIDLPFSPLPPRAQLEEDAKSSNKYEAARAAGLLRRLDAGQPIPSAYPYPIGVWRLGDEIQFIFLGGEVVVDYALRLKAELSGVRTWVAGYSNDVMAYIASRRVLAEGGYEGGKAMIYYGLPTAWAPESEDLLVGAVHSLVQRAAPAAGRVQGK